MKLLDKWQSRLRNQGYLGWQKIIRAIEDIPGATLGEKRMHWEQDAKMVPRGFWAGLRANLDQGRVTDLLNEMIDVEGSDAVVESTRPKKPVPTEPLDVRERHMRQAEVKVAQEEAAQAAIAVYERKRLESVAGLDPDSEEYKRRWARWARLIEDEMKR